MPPVRILPNRLAASTTSTAPIQPWPYGTSTNTDTSSRSSSSAAATTRPALPARSSRSRSAISAATISSPGRSRRARATRPPAPLLMTTLTGRRLPVGSGGRVGRGPGHLGQLRVRHHQRSDQRGVPGGAVLPVPAYGLGHARAAGREHRGVVDQAGEQCIHGVHACTIGPCHRRFPGTLSTTPPTTSRRSSPGSGRPACRCPRLPSGPATAVPRSSSRTRSAS